MDEATISATSGGAADAERFLMVADGVQYGPFAEGAHASLGGLVARCLC